MSTKTTTTYPLRLSEAEAAELRSVARIDGLTIADELRLAIRERMEQLRKDPVFQDRLRSSIERDRELYDRLGAEGLDDY